MGDYADDAIDRDFHNTYGGHDWHDKNDHYPHRIQRLSGGGCPMCTGTLVTRTNSRNNQQFLGCDRFPKCRYSL